MASTIATAYVAIRPSVEGISSELNKSIKKSLPGMKRAMSKAMGDAAVGASRGASGAFSSIGKLATTHAQNFSKALGTGFTNAAAGAGRVLNNSMKTALVTATAGIGAVAGQAAIGGLNRAVDFGDATAKLKALGYEGQRLESVMKAVRASVDGTSYSLPEATKTATTLMAAGVTSGQELEKTLKQTTKLADMTGASFDEMGYLMSKNAASGTIYAEDLNQFLERGVDMAGAIGKTIGKSNAEVKKMASEGKVSFEMLQNAIDATEFDSVLYASSSVKKSFGNLRTSISRIGETIWRPIIDSAPNLFMTLKEGFDALQKNSAFTDLVNRINTETSSVMDIVQRFADKMKEVFSSNSIVGGFIDKIKQDFDKLRGLFSGGEVILAGGLIGAIGKLLQNIPVLGGMFGSLSVPVGLFLGLITTLSTKSENFSRLIGNIVDSAKSFAQGFSGSFDGSLFSAFDNLDDKANNVESFIGKIAALFSPSTFGELGATAAKTVQSIAGSILDNKDSIVKVFDTIKQAVKDGLDTLMELTGSETAPEAIGKTISGIVETVASVLSAIVPLAVTLGKIAGDVITSDITKGILNSLLDIAKWAANNEGVLKGGIAALAAIFVGGKIAKVFGAFDKFKLGGKGKGGNPFESITGLISKGIDSLNPIIKSIGRVGSSLVKALGKIGSGLVTAMARVGQAAITGAPYLAAFAGLILGIGGVIALLDAMNLFDILDKIVKNSIDNVMTVVEDASNVAMSIGNFIKDTLISVLGALATHLPPITGALGDFTSVVAGSIGSTVLSLVGLMTSLSTLGVPAGAGAVSLATGLTALSLALGAIAGVDAISKIPIIGDSGGVISKITEVSKSLSDFATNIPKLLESSAPQAYSAGVKTIESFSDGLVSGFGTTESTLKNKVNNMLQNLQSQLNAKPLEVKVKTPNIAAANGSRSNTLSGGRVYNYNIRTTNEANLEQILRSAR